VGSAAVDPATDTAILDAEVAVLDVLVRVTEFVRPELDEPITIEGPEANSDCVVVLIVELLLLNSRPE